MNRNIIALSEYGKSKISDRRDLRVDEISIIADAAKKGAEKDFFINLIMISFYLGYALGIKNNK